MIRIAHTACLALLVIVVVVSYGVKEETSALMDEKQELAATLERKRVKIATLEAEWTHLTSEPYLRALAARLYGEGRLLGAEGEPLEPLGLDQLLVLEQDDPAAMATSEIRRRAPAEQDGTQR